jgi:hypothetical protein
MKMMSFLLKPLPLTFLVFFIALLTMLCLRFWLIEPETMGAACSNATLFLWCYPRQLLIWGMAYSLFAYASSLLLALSLFGSIKRSRCFLLASIIFSSMALIFYSAGTGSVLLLVGLLRAVYLSENTQTHESTL